MKLRDKKGYNMGSVKFCLITLFLFISFSPVSFAEPKSDYKVIILTEKPFVDPGETITFDIYIVGNGNIEANKFVIYTDSAFRIIELNFTDEKMNKESDMQQQLKQEGSTILAGNIPPTVFKSVGSVPEFSPLITELKPIFRITASIPDDILTGDHELSIAFTYGDDEQWNVYKTNSKFHVRNLLERHEKITFIGILAGIVIAFFGICSIIYPLYKNMKQCL